MQRVSSPALNHGRAASEFDYEGKDRLDSFRNRKGTAEGILLGLTALLFAIGVTFIVLFASKIETKCLMNTIDVDQSECTVKRMNIWIGPGLYWFHRTQSLFTGDIIRAHLEPKGMREWEDEHETAEEMDHLSCQTVVLTNNGPNIPITILSRPCFDSSAADELNEFLNEIQNWIPSSGDQPSFYYSQSTAVWPQFLGMGLVIISAILGAAYYYNAPSRYLQYLHQ